MKMVKSLLLGSAAVLVAVAGAQAADLPVKAKPVEYVKVCSLYGAGYYYIPGTDVCVKVGGYVRQEWTYGYGASISTGPWISTSSAHTRSGGAADTVWRTRAYINMDSRQQTAYGTLRTFFQLGISGNNSVDLSANRAFIQIAGFTVGKATSYFDFYSGAATGYFVELSSDSGDGGQNVFAYTAQLGNGVSASLSLEDPSTRRHSIVRDGDGFSVTSVVNNSQLINGGWATTNRYAKLRAPDVVANLRIAQAWGSAQIMGALHDASAGYYVSNSQNNGHPEDKWGWAAGAGLRVNLPMIAPGDYFQAQVAYSEGALKYIANQPSVGFNSEYRGGNSIGYGIWTDGIYGGSVAAGTATSVLLTTGWGVAAAVEHFWTPSLRTSLRGGYVEVKYSRQANDLLCTALTTAVNGSAAVSAVTSGTCNNNFSMWQVGSRTQWNVTKDFYMGFDVIYGKLQTASKGMVATVQGFSGQPTTSRTFEDQDVVAARVRWHRDIAP